MIIILLLISIITHIPWFDFSTILFNSDWTHRSNIATKEILYGGRSMWINSFGTGSQNIQPSFNLFMWVRGLFGYNIGTKITFLIPIAILGFITPYILSYFLDKNKGVAFFVALFYGFNTYFIVRQTAHLPIAFVFSIAPLLIYYYLNFIKGKKNIQFILLFFLACGYEVRIVFILCFLLLIITCFHIKDVIKNIKTIFFSLLVILFLNLFWFLPSLMQSSEIADIAYRGLFGSHLFTLQHAFTLYDSSWTGGAPNMYFKTQPVQVLFWIFPLLAFLGLFFRKDPDKKYFYIGFIFSILGITLTKQSAEPFSYLYQWLYDNFPGFSLFREASKFYIITSLGYLILISGSLNLIFIRFKKLFYIIASLLTIVLLTIAYPMITKKIGTMRIHKEISNDRIQTNNFIDNQKGSFKVVGFPHYSQWQTYSFSHPKVSAVGSMLNFTGRLNINIYEDVTKKQFYKLANSKYFEKISNNFGIKYFIISPLDRVNDDDFYQWYGDESDPNKLNYEHSLKQYHYYYNLLKKQNRLTEINIGIKDGVHIFENKGYLGLLYSKNGISFSMTNPTKYHLSLTLPSDRLSDSLSFLQSFHKEWKLYPGRSFKCSESSTMTGQDISYLPISYTISSGDTLSGVIDKYATTVDNLMVWNTGWTIDSGLAVGQEMVVGQDTGTVREYQTTECLQSGYTFFEGEELSYLWKKPLREESHEVVNEYANGWEVSLTGQTGSQILEEGLKKGWIVRNDDGSYQVDLVLYFRPQSWFYVGLMISGTTLISLLGRLAWDRRRRRDGLSSNREIVE